MGRASLLEIAVRHDARIPLPARRGYGPYDEHHHEEHGSSTRVTRSEATRDTIKRYCCPTECIRSRIASFHLKLASVTFFRFVVSPGRIITLHESAVSDGHQLMRRPALHLLVDFQLIMQDKATRMSVTN